MRESGKGLELQLKVRRLMRKHGVEINVEDLCLVPMAAETDGPQILQGVASTSDVDLHRMKFRPFAFGWPLPKSCRDVPLLWKHKLGEVAGRIESIEYGDAGQLLVRAHVTHEQARRAGAFSIGATVWDYQLVTPEQRDFHAVITNARLDELSCTDVPANPQCRVLQRHPVSARVAFLGHAQSAMQLLQQSLVVLQQMQRGVPR